jgi:hypothetical protein
MKSDSVQSNSTCEDIDGYEIGANPTTMDIKLVKYGKKQ